MTLRSVYLTLIAEADNTLEMAYQKGTPITEADVERVRLAVA